MKVRCVDNSGKASDKLVLNREYEIVADTITNDGVPVYELKGVAGVWVKTRFTNAPMPVKQTSAVKPTIKQVLNDIEEENCWKAMRPRVEIGHCPCGCHRSLCIYHRDETQTLSKQDDECDCGKPNGRCNCRC